MTVSYNEKTGEALQLNAAGDGWTPTRTATNPTGEIMALDGMTWVKVGMAPAESPGAAFGVLEGAAKGTSFGFADKGVAYLRSKIYDTPYEREHADIRKRQEAFYKDSPYLSTSSELLGGLATGGYGAARVLGAKILQNAPRLLKIGATALTGAGEGGLAGAGYAPAGREAEGAKTGAILGTAVAAGGAPVLYLGTKLFQVLRNRLGKKAARSWMDGKLVEAMSRDGVSIDEAQRRLASGDYGEYASIFDIGGEALENFARTITSMSGKAQTKAREFFDARAEGAVGRSLRAIIKSTGASGNYYKSMDELVVRQKKISDKLYGAARGRGLRITEELHEILSRPGIQKYAEVAQETAANTGRPLPKVLDALVNEGKLEIKVGKVFDLDAVDQIKRGLDTVIEQSRNVVTGKLNLSDPYIRSLVDLKTDLLAATDKVLPVYGKARAAYAGFARQQDAMSLGRKFMRGDTELLAERVGKMSVDEKASFMEGVTRQIGDMLDNNMNAGNVIRQLMKKGKYQKALKEVLGDDIGEFNRFLKTEMKYSDVAYKSFGGSPTARILEDQKDFFVDPDLWSSAAYGIMTSNPIPLLGNVGRKLVDAIRRPPPKARDAAADFFTKNPAAINKFLERARGTPFRLPGLPEQLTPQSGAQLRGGLLGLATQQSGGRAADRR